MIRVRNALRVAAATLAAALVTVGSVIAAANGGREERAAVVSGPGSFPVASTDAAVGLNESDLLRDAPWLSQVNGSPSIRDVEALPSLVFAPETTYDEAIEALFVAVKTTGGLPGDATLGPPLPKEIVFAHSSTAAALSLTAPFGYDTGTGNVLMPSIRYPRGMSPAEIERARVEAIEENRAIPAGANVVGNPLEACQILVNGVRGSECT